MRIELINELKAFPPYLTYGVSGSKDSYRGWIRIGNEYMETDKYPSKKEAMADLSGFVEGLKMLLDEALNNINNIQ